MFEQLNNISKRPEPFEYYTAADLWTDPHTSAQMLNYHLNSEIDVSSRRSEFIEKSVDWIASYFNVGAGARIIDFGCGPGLYSNRLAKLGASVQGIDFSERSVAYAQKVAAESGLSSSYVCKNYLEFESDDRVDLIMMIMCDFCALSPVQRMIMLKKFRILLAPGGAILLDVYSHNAFHQREESVSFEKNMLNGLWSPENYYAFLNTFKYDDVKVILDKYSIIENTRTRTVYNWLQYFSPDSLMQEFKKAGFTNQLIYGNVAGAPYNDSANEFAIVGKLE